MHQLGGSHQKSEVEEKAFSWSKKKATGEAEAFHLFHSRVRVTVTLAPGCDVTGAYSE